MTIRQAIEYALQGCKITHKHYFSKYKSNYFYWDINDHVFRFEDHIIFLSFGAKRKMTQFIELDPHMFDEELLARGNTLYSCTMLELNDYRNAVRSMSSIHDRRIYAKFLNDKYYGKSEISMCSPLDEVPLV